MTFTEIQSAVTDYCLLTSTAATTRVGKAINRHYKRITSQLGLEATRFVTRSQSMSIGVRTVTFTDIEKIDRILDTTDSTSIRLLDEISIHELRSSQPGDGEPSRWALQNTDADSVVALFDTIPQVAYSLQADGWTTLADLSGSDEPVIPESFHDILVWYVIAEELLKKEKDKLAATYMLKAEKLLSDLRFHLADSPMRDTRQAGGSSPIGSGVSGGGGGTVGGTAYTQTALITFDRDPSAPFAVTSWSAVVPNLDADKLDGLDSLNFARLASANAGSLLFVDGTYDIGASGATRPRHAYFSGDAVFGGDLAVNGGDVTSASTTANLFNTTVTTANVLGSCAALTLGATTGYTNIRHLVFINDTANAKMTRGLTVNQGSADDEILALKSSDVAHAMTDLAEADTFGAVAKQAATSGGVNLTGYTTAANTGVALMARITGAGDTTRSVAANGGVRVTVQERSGATTANPTANTNMLVVDGSAGAAFILDSDGDSHQDVGTAWTNFDAEDDLEVLHLLAAHVSRPDDPLRAAFGEWLLRSRAVLERLRLVTFNDDGHHFINMSRLTMLLVGQARQMGARINRLESRLLALEA